MLLKLNPIEPPWYGPVCPVVWEGRRREVSPIPINPRIHQHVFGRLAGIGIENEVDLDALRVAHDGHVIAGCPAREGEPEDPVKGEGAVEIAHPNTDVIDPLDIDGLAHPTPPRWKPETM